MKLSDTNSLTILPLTLQNCNLLQCIFTLAISASITKEEVFLLQFNAVFLHTIYLLLPVPIMDGAYTFIILFYPAFAVFSLFLTSLR